MPLHLRRSTPAPAPSEPARPAPDPVITASTPVSATEPDAPSAPRQPGIMAYRRRRALVATLSLAAVVAWIVETNVTTSGPTTVTALDQSASTPLSISSPSSVLGAIVTDAQSYALAHGTFTGFTVSRPGILVGAAGAGMVASYRTGSTCYYTGILPSGVKRVLVDPTGSACTTSAVAAAQSALASDRLDPASAQASLAQLSARATSLLSGWSRSAHSFASLTTLGLPGTAIRTVTADQVVIAVHAAGACATLTVPVAGPVITSVC